MELKELTAFYNEAFIRKDFEAIQLVVSTLNKLDSPLKKNSLAFYEKIDNDLFQINRSVINLDLERFKNEIRKWEKEQTTPKLKPAKATLDLLQEEDFNLIFKNFYERHKKIFSNLKNFYFLKFQSANPIKPLEIVILCDEHSENRPEFEKLIKEETILKTSKKNLQSFAIENTKEIKNINSHLLCILSLTPSIKEDESLKDNLNSIFNLFDSFHLLELETDKNNNLEDFKLKNLKSGLSEYLVVNSNKIFNNIKLTYQEQKIMKSAIGDYPAVIDYKVLKPGNSGSGVIEIRANLLNATGSKRFVIKFCWREKDSLSKIEIELKKFANSVESLAINGYSAKLLDTESLVGIKYNYASTDSITDSSSFYDLLEFFIKEKHETSDILIKVISKLFDCPLILAWKILHKKEKRVSDLFKSYITTTNEQKVIEAIQKIENKEETQVRDSELLKNYFNIKNSILETNEKICHGDLHSENFFWDQSDVYLIDFGFTEVHPAIIDHAFLEVSIKLRHFPRYIEIGELLNYEEKFLDIKTFNENFDLDFIKRNKLKELYRIINIIRTDSKQYCVNKENPLKEYLTALFIITFRLTQYPDLHQLYSLKMAELLSRKLTNGTI